EEERDAVSSKGWAFGYVGGALLLALNLVLYAKREAFGLSSGMAVRLSLCSAGVWWGIFTLVPMLALHSREPVHHLPPGESVVTAGFRQLGRTLRSMGQYPQTLLYLVAFLLYNDGIQAVIALSAQFGAEELGLEQGTLIQAILL